MAEAALAQLDLDGLRIMPTGQAWHKAHSLTCAEHRVAMCQLAFGDLPRTCIDSRETTRQGPSYTADTLAELALEYPGAVLYLMLGADQLLAFKSWVRWTEVLECAQLAVADRALHIGADAALDQREEMNLSAVDLPFVRLSMPLTNISASAVRSRVEQPATQRAAIARLVPASVASYIARYSLYQDPS